MGLGAVDTQHQSSLHMLGMHGTPFANYAVQEADLIINTTPIGMNSSNTKQENVPLGHKIWDCLSNKTILYDLIYTPRPTNWLKIGQQKNCFTIDGLDMLVEQGAFSIRLWSGFHDVPVQTMKSSAEKLLMV